MPRSLTGVARAVARQVVRSTPLLRRWRRGGGFSDAWWREYYAREYDPFGFDSNPYERGKYEHLMQALEGRRYGQALEVGCSIGTFTERLATICDELLAIDFVEAAVDRARERLADTPGVRVERRACPDELPARTFDLIVCSDVLYYLPYQQLPEAMRRLAAMVRPKGTFLALHYLGDFGQPSMGDEVHDLLPRMLEGFALTRSERRTGIGPRGAGYRLDRYDRVPASAKASRDLENMMPEGRA